MMRSGGWDSRRTLGMMFNIMFLLFYSGMPCVFAVSSTQALSGSSSVPSPSVMMHSDPSVMMYSDTSVMMYSGPSVMKYSGPSVITHSDPSVIIPSGSFVDIPISEVLANSIRNTAATAAPVLADSIQVPAGVRHSENVQDQAEKVDPSKTVRTLLPMIAYTSDLGLIGGIVLQQIRYRTERQERIDANSMDTNSIDTNSIDENSIEANSSVLPPHESLIQANILATTKKRWDGEIEMEFAGWNRWRVRHQHRIEFIREPESTYFGLGNNTAFSATDLENGRYFYLKQWFQWESLIRRSVKPKESSKIVDLFVKSGLIYAKSSVSSPLELAQNELSNTILEQEQPIGIGSGRSVYLGLGLVVDGRDHELSPQNGFRYEAGVTGSSPVFGSDYAYFEIAGDFRHYITLFKGNPFWEVTFAQQARFRTVIGEQAFWQKPVLGNDDGLRGYVQDRFVGQHSALHILEARKWLISGFDDTIRLGGQFFWDSGRVFSKNDSNSVLQDWKHTYGLSGLLSLLSPDIVFRVDLAFSSETQRWYAGLGYLF